MCKEVGGVSWFWADDLKPNPRKELTPDEIGSPDHGAVSIPPCGMRDLKESFRGDRYGQARGVLEKFLNAESARLRDRFVGCGRYAQEEGRGGQRNGFYFRDFVSRFGTLRLQVARTREQSFLPGALARFQRRAAEGDAADPGSVFTRHLDAAGGASGGHSHRRGGERADGLAVDSELGRAGESLSLGVRRR